MEQTLKELLKQNYGLNDDQVAGIEKLGVKIESDMVLLKESDLTGVEINVITARKIVAAYKPIEPATAPVTDATSSAPGELPKTADASDDALAKQLGLGNQTALLALLAGSGNTTALFGMIKVKALLELYDPEEPDNLAANLLQQRFGDKPVIAFKPGTRDVATDETAEYIQDLRRGYPEAVSIDVGGRQARLYRVGVIPENFVEEDPLAPGQPLRRGKSVVHRGLDYSALPLNVRQYMRVAVELGSQHGGIDPEDRRDRTDMFKVATDGIDALIAAYPDVDLAYRDHETAGTLPLLRAQLGGGAGIPGQSFRPIRRVGQD
ncbi:MAG: hypothetical protein AAB624_02510 [Patescibacteria group bacterium]